jgi:Uma2 family endonuclease
MAQAQVTRTPSFHSDSPGVPLDAFIALGTDQVVEVIDGEMVMMSPQKLENTEIAHEIMFSIESLIHGKNLGKVFTEVTYSPDIDDRKRRVRGSLVPDVAFISMERYLEQIKKHGRKEFLRVAPDLVVEIISPDDKYSEISRKVELYLQYGTQLVIIIDPQLRNARVITSDNPSGLIVGEDAILSGEPVLPGWSISLKELLSGKK